MITSETLYGLEIIAKDFSFQMMYHSFLYLQYFLCNIKKNETRSTPYYRHSGYIVPKA